MKLDAKWVENKKTEKKKGKIRMLSTLRACVRADQLIIIRQAASHQHHHLYQKQPVTRTLHTLLITLIYHAKRTYKLTNTRHAMPTALLFLTLTEREREREEDRMKESVKAVVGRPSSGGGRSESDKERTKLRERQRRAITTKIFHGLRKWGGYHLSPRADINEVLRELAKEAGWVIDPDGTTYRATLPMNPCPVCGGKTPTTSSSIVMVGGGGGDCSTTASPRHVSPNINNITSGSTTTCTRYSSGEAGLPDIPLALYLYEGLPTSSVVIGGGGPVAQQQFQLQEMRASNQNTPAASPLRRPF